MFREEAAQTNRDYRAGAARRSAGSSSGISLSADSELQTCGYKDIKRGHKATTGYLVFGDLFLFLERPFESMNGECCCVNWEHLRIVLVVQAGRGKISFTMIFRVIPSLYIHMRGFLLD